MSSGRPAPDQVVDRDFEVAGERYALRVSTRHGPATATTVVHRLELPRSQGGVRFVRRGTLEEACHLARGMTEKSAAALVPVDGQKTLIGCEARELTRGERAQILADHIRAVLDVHDRGIFGPDMGCDEATLSLLAADSSLLPHLTGLTRTWGGFEINRIGATAHGLDAALSPVDVEGKQVAIQGFGAVGSGVGMRLAARGARITCVSTAAGTLQSDSNGLDVDRLLDLRARYRDDLVKHYAGAGVTYDQDPTMPLRTEAHVLIPAARTSVAATSDELASVRTENPQVIDVDRMNPNGHLVAVVEAANHPLSAAAETSLAAQGVSVLTDVLVNCGGLIACYWEWCERSSLRDDPARWEAARETMLDTIRDVVASSVERLGSPTDPRQATDAIVSANRALLVSGKAMLDLRPHDGGGTG